MKIASRKEYNENITGKKIKFNIKRFLQFQSNQYNINEFISNT